MQIRILLTLLGHSAHHRYAAVPETWQLPPADTTSLGRGQHSLCQRAREQPNVLHSTATVSAALVLVYVALIRCQGGNCRCTIAFVLKRADGVSAVSVLRATTLLLDFRHCCWTRNGQQRATWILRNCIGLQLCHTARQPADRRLPVPSCGLGAIAAPTCSRPSLYQPAKPQLYCQRPQPMHYQ